MKHLPVISILLRFFFICGFVVIFVFSLTQKVFAGNDGANCCNVDPTCGTQIGETCACSGVKAGCDLERGYNTGTCVCTHSGSQGCNDPPWGACVNYCQTRILSCGVDTPSGYATWQQLEVRSCDGGTCVDATEDPQSGVYCWPTGAIKTSPSNNTTFLVTQSELTNFPITFKWKMDKWNNCTCACKSEDSDGNCKSYYRPTYYLYLYVGRPSGKSQMWNNKIQLAKIDDAAKIGLANINAKTITRTYKYNVDYYWLVVAQNCVPNSTPNANTIAASWLYKFNFAPPPETNSCEAQMTPNSMTLAAGDKGTITTSVGNILPAGKTVQRVVYSSSNTSVATVSPIEDSTAPFETEVTAAGTGVATVTATAYIDGLPACASNGVLGSSTSPTQVFVSPPVGWWQVVDSDILAKGNLRSSVPISLYFNLASEGGFPGVPVYSASTNLTSANVSEKGWLVNSDFSRSKVYSMDYYMRQAPRGEEVTNLSLPFVEGNFFESDGTEHEGYYWYSYDGSNFAWTDLNVLSDMNLGERKVVLMVKNANVNLQGKINLTKGRGFFLIIANGNINISPSVGGASSPSLEGIFMTDGVVSTGTEGVRSDSQLWVRGSIASMGGINLQRDLGDIENATTPAEKFEYAPDQELLFPQRLSYRAHMWREIAP